MSKPIYLDHAATTPVCPAAAKAAVDVMTEGFGNPSSHYPLGRAAARLWAARPRSFSLPPAAPRGTTGPSPPP